MFFIAIGTGSIKPNVNSFGADQFLGGGEKTKPAQQSFFTYYYQSVNVGSFISFVFLVGLVDSYGFFLPYALSAGAMATAALIFLCASPWYKHAQLGATGGTQTMAVIGRHIVHSAIKGPKCGHKARAWASLVGWCLIPVFLVNSLAGAFLKDSEYIDLINILAILMGTTCIGCLTVAHIDNSWIETIPDSYCLFCDKCWFYGCFCCIFTKKKEKEPEDDYARLDNPFAEVIKSIDELISILVGPDVANNFIGVVEHVLLGGVLVLEDLDASGFGGRHGSAISVARWLAG